MTLTSKEFYELFRDLEHQPLRYSGRAMFGKQCISVNTVNTLRVVVDIMELVATEAISSVWDQDSDEATKREAEAVGRILAVGDILRGSRTDQMGREAVIYWPSMEWDPKIMTDYDNDRENEDDDILDEDVCNACGYAQSVCKCE